MRGIKVLNINKTEVGVIEPATLAEIKAWGYISHDTDDALVLDPLVTTDRQWLENYTRTSLIQKTIVFQLETDGCTWFELPYGPVISITSIVDEDEVAQVVDTDYEVMGDNNGFKRVKILNEGVYKITYSAGYATVPLELKQALMEKVLFDYENRGKVDVGVVSKAELTAKKFIRKSWI